MSENNEGRGELRLKDITHTIDAYADEAFEAGYKCGRAEGLRVAARILDSRAQGWRASAKNYEETPGWSRDDNAKASALEEEAKNLHGLADPAQETP